MKGQTEASSSSSSSSPDEALPGTPADDVSGFGRRSRVRRARLLDNSTFVFPATPPQELLVTRNTSPSSPNRNLDASFRYRPFQHTLKSISPERSTAKV